MSKAVIFDHDGVIIDNQPAQKKAWKKLFEEFGLNISDEEMSRKIRGRPTLVGLRNFFEDRFSESELVAIAKRKEELYVEIFKKDFKIVRGFNDLLIDLKKHNIPMAIATSTSSELLNLSMRRLEVKKFFDVIVTSEDITQAKPDPQIYLLTANKLGVEPADCLVFEDSFSGVLSARDACMKVVLVETTHKKSEFESGISLAINDFTGITALDIINL